MQQIELEDARTLLRRTPDVLDALLGGLPDGRMTCGNLRAAIRVQMATQPNDGGPSRG
jgi:hypothetical protein